MPEKPGDTQYRKDPRARLGNDFETLYANERVSVDHVEISDEMAVIVKNVNLFDGIVELAAHSAGSRQNLEDVATVWNEPINQVHS